MSLLSALPGIQLILTSPLGHSYTDQLKSIMDNNYTRYGAVEAYNRNDDMLNEAEQTGVINAITSDQMHVHNVRRYQSYCCIKNDNML